jgi:NAD(P)H-nitrite reductase large subunit
VTTRHVIVGTGIAALSAAEAIRHADPRGTITMIGPETGPFYSRPGLAYWTTREVPESQLSIRTPADVAALRLDRRAGRVVGLDSASHRITLEGGERLAYGRLLVATGAASMAADFPGAQLAGVLQVDDLEDARAFVARAKTARAAVVVGGGSTALELVDGLHAHGVETHYCMRGARYWSRVFDEVESAIVEAGLLANGIHLHRLSAVREAVGTDGHLTGILTSRGEHIPCDLLAVAVGIQPRLELARAGGLRTERGILVNEFLETSAADVFAAGDVAQVFDPVTGRAQLDTLWASALAQGRIAGLNMAGIRVAHRARAALNVTRVGGITATIIGRVGAGDDPDLLTLTRGQSERWAPDPDAWTIAGAVRGDRLRVLLSGRVIVGAVVLGDQRVSRALAHLIGEGVDISALRPALEARPDDAMTLLLEFCDHHVSDRAAPHH